MHLSLRRHPGPWIAGVLVAVFVAVVGLQPTAAQRPPVSPPGGNPGNGPGNPANPGRLNPPAQPAPNQGGNRNGQGMAPMGQPNPGANPGAPEIVWQCTNCKAELGRSSTKPDLTVCPHCGARFDPNYTAPNLANNSGSGSSAPPIGLLGFACIGFLVAVVVIAVLIKWALG